MTKPIRIVISMEPVPKARPRMKWINGQAITYTPTPTRNAQDFIKARVLRYRERAFPKYFPTKLTCTFFRTKGKWLTKKDIIPTRKPDLINFASLLCDAMSEMVYDDDSQLSHIVMKKRWSTTREGYITIKLEEDTL